MTGGRVGQTEAIEGPWVVVITDETIAEVRAGPLRPGDPDDVTDVGTALATPGLVDPHTHLCFAGDRSAEAAARSRGERYTGGGILDTVRATSEASDEDVVALTRARLVSAAASGTTTIEVKSGYGLDAEAELRLLRVIAEAAAGMPIRVLRTYLGAHAVPEGSTAAAHADAVIATIPDVAADADFADVFCEPRLFDLALTRGILAAGQTHGLGLRLHADQLERSGAALLGIEMGALSVDHLEQASPEDARALGASTTVATVLPGPALMLREGLPPIRALVEAGACVAIGTDANAGTFGAASMPLAIGLAVAIGLSVDEALWAATAGAARSLGLGGRVGALAPGAAADLVAWDAEHEGAFALRLDAVAPVARSFGGVHAALVDRLEYAEDSLAALRGRDERNSTVAWSEVRR
jgi:imidazolonepropionase